MALSLSVTPVVAEGVRGDAQSKKPAYNAPFLYAVGWQQHAAERVALCYQTYNQATQAIAEKIRLGNYAKRDGRLYQDTFVQAPDGTLFVDSRPLAIVLDLDETVVDNIAYEAFNTARPGPYDNGYWSKWCTYQAQTPAAQKAMPGAVPFLKKCMEWGVTPIYISNRDLPERAATIQTLRGLGLDCPDLEKNTITRDKAKDKENAAAFVAKMGWAKDDPRAQAILNNASDKQGRRAIIETQYKVIGYFGDNLYDHPVVVNPEARGMDAINARKASVSDNSTRWGVDWFILPNVTYGSWVKPVIYPEKSKSAVELMDDAGFGAWLKANG